MNSNSESNDENASYVGRFAPSPTGPLHFGSLLAAVASFLDARANQGSWLLRMEDLDPPREPAGAADQILRQLSDLGLHWDGEVLYQSSRLGAYAEVLERLRQQQLCYACDCTRPQIKAMGSVYDGRCRKRDTAPQGEFAIRLITEPIDITIHDLVQGHYQQNIERDIGDFVIRRKDTLFAYQLAVVVDDEYQNITHVIRGFDLIDSTPRQIYLQRLLKYHTPVYGHVPVIVNESGQKLSKQHFAEAIDANNGRKLIHQALIFLGQSPALLEHYPDSATLLQWGIDNWDIQAVPKLANIPHDSLE